MQLTWFMTTSLQTRNYFVGHSGDTYLRMMLWWAIFLPLGEHFSLDKIRNEASFIQPRTTRAWISNYYCFCSLFNNRARIGWFYCNFISIHVHLYFFCTREALACMGGLVRARLERCWFFFFFVFSSLPFFFFSQQAVQHTGLSTLFLTFWHGLASMCDVSTRSTRPPHLPPQSDGSTRQASLATDDVGRIGLGDGRSVHPHVPLAYQCVRCFLSSFFSIASLTPSR